MTLSKARRQRVDLAMKMLDGVADAETREEWDLLMMAAALVALCCARKWMEVDRP